LYVHKRSFGFGGPAFIQPIRAIQKALFCPPIKSFCFWTGKQANNNLLQSTKIKVVNWWNAINFLI